MSLEAPKPVISTSIVDSDDVNDDDDVDDDDDDDGDLSPAAFKLLRRSIFKATFNRLIVNKNIIASYFCLITAFFNPRHEFFAQRDFSLLRFSKRFVASRCFLGLNRLEL